MPQILQAKTNKQPIVAKKSNIQKSNDIIIRSRFVRVAPDKIRLVGQLIVKKKVEQALVILQLTPNIAKKPLILIIKEAISRIKEGNTELDNTYIKTVAVNEGPKLKRRRIIHRGRATNILKRMSHVTVVLSDNVKSKSQKSNFKKNPKAQK